MSITLTFDSIGGAPQIYLKMSERKNEKSEIYQQRFKEIVDILQHGPVTLGHSNFFQEEQELDVFLIRTHWVGDDEGYSKLGNGNEAFRKKIENENYEVDHYIDVYDKKQDQHFVRAFLKRKSNPDDKLEIDIQHTDRHAPLIDGIYAILLLAHGFFPKSEIKFALTDSGKAFLGGAVQQDPTVTKDFGIEPTYFYIHKLQEALHSLKNTENEQVELVRNDFSSAGTAKKTFIEKATVYNGVSLLENIKKDYVNLDHKKIWDVCGVEQAAFVGFYTPLEQLKKECENQISKVSSVIKGGESGQIASISSIVKDKEGIQISKVSSSKINRIFLKINNFFKDLISPLVRLWNWLIKKSR